MGTILGLDNEEPPTTGELGCGSPWPGLLGAELSGERRTALATSVPWHLVPEQWLSRMKSSLSMVLFSVTVTSVSSSVFGCFFPSIPQHRKGHG